MEDLSNKTLASLVTGNHRVVPVLEKYNLDFCCRGKRSLGDACREKGLEPGAIVKELNAVTGDVENKSMPFTEMSAEQLVNHILIRHHYYVKQAMPLIMMHLEKVAIKHGDNFPFMKEVLALFGIIQEEMVSHMKKEELILFPRIREMEKLNLQKSGSTAPDNYLAAPISVMENEHEHAGDTMFRIRNLTNNYSVPEGACTTFRVCLSELKEFEDDLHEHVHLENNILFPKALQFN